jgi:hypothetical protein
MYDCNGTNSNLITTGSDMLLGLSDMAMTGSRWLISQARDGLGALSGVVAHTQGQIRHSLDNLRFRDERQLAVVRACNRRRPEELDMQWDWRR